MKQTLSRLWQWVGLFSGIIGLVVLVQWVDVHAVFAAFADAELFLLFPAALLVLFTTAVRALRWIFLFRQRGVRIPFFRLFGTNLIGSFYGQFLPLSSAVGASLLFGENAQAGGRPVDFLSAVLVERVLNLVSLFVTASAVLLLAQPAGLPRGFAPTMYAVSAILIAGLLLLQRAKRVERLPSIFARLRLGQLHEYLGTLRGALQSDLGRTPVLARGIALSVLVNASLMATSYLVTLSVAGTVPILSFLVMATLIVTLQGIPITPGSLGVRESLYVFFLGGLGVSEPAALTVGLLVTTLGWFHGVVGGLVLLQRSLPQLSPRRALSSIGTMLSP